MEIRFFMLMVCLPTNQSLQLSNHLTINLLHDNPRYPKQYFSKYISVVKQRLKCKLHEILTHFGHNELFKFHLHINNITSTTGTWELCRITVKCVLFECHWCNHPRSCQTRYWHFFNKHGLFPRPRQSKRTYRSLHLLLVAQIQICLSAVAIIVMNDL